MRRVLLVAVVLGLLVAVAPPAVAGDPPATTTTLPVAVEAPSIIPKPNSGVAPSEPGDRGGALQAAVFVGILAGIGVIGLLVVRQSRQARACRPRVTPAD